MIELRKNYYCEATGIYTVIKNGISHNYQIGKNPRINLRKKTDRK